MVDSTQTSDKETGRPTMAIVVGDVIDSIRLLQAVGDFQARLLFEEFSSRLKDFFERHSGEYIKTIGLGDGFLAVFPSVERALRFAEDFDDYLSAFPISSNNIVLRARFAIHVSPVYFEATAHGTDVFGPGIAYSLRLNGAIRSAGIALSDAAHRELDSNKIADHSQWRPEPSELIGFDGTSTVWVSVPSKVA